MEHSTKDGRPKLVERCTYPLTAIGSITRIYTDLAVIDVTAAGFVLRDCAPGIDRNEVQARTGAPLRSA